MAQGDAREGKWIGNWPMQWVASTLHTTSEHGVSSINTADAHTSAASSRLNWRPPADLNGLVRFVRKTKSDFCVCAITFQLASTCLLRCIDADSKASLCNVWIVKCAPYRYRYVWSPDLLDCSWNVMAHGDALEGKWRGNWRMEWVASTLHTTSEHCVSSITTADAHTLAASSRLNWRLPVDLKDSSFSPKDEIWFLRVCHHISNAVWHFVWDEGRVSGKNVEKLMYRFCSVCCK